MNNSEFENMKHDNAILKKALLQIASANWNDLNKIDVPKSPEDCLQNMYLEIINIAKESLKEVL